MGTFTGSRLIRIIFPSLWVLEVQLIQNPNELVQRIDVTWKEKDLHSDLNTWSLKKTVENKSLSVLLVYILK